MVNIVHGKRFANTFLGYHNLDKAINDEVMIDKTNGMFYYKRPDGVVIDIFAGISVNPETIAQLTRELKQYTDEQIQASGGSGGSSKMVHYRYTVKATTQGQTEFIIPLTTFDSVNDMMIVNVNTVTPDEGVTVTDDKVILAKGLNIGDGVHMIIFKNVPVGTTGTVSGTIIAPNSIDESRLAPSLRAKIAAGGTGGGNGTITTIDGSFIMSDTEPVSQPVGGIWVQPI